MRPSVAHTLITQRQISKLKKLRLLYGKDYDSDWMHEEIRLKVTYPGCAYDDVIDRNKNLGSVLSNWYEKLPAMSWEGLERKMPFPEGEEVVNAREITAEHIEVPPVLLEQVRAAWVQQLLPRDVRVEVFKIFIYGPGGHIFPHHEAPEEGMVGTFLMGLGSTASSGAPAGVLRVGPNRRGWMRTNGGRWIASYAHDYREVTPWETGYQAVLAFKVFRVSDDSVHLAPTVKVERHCRDLDDDDLEENKRDVDGDQYAQALPQSLVPDAIRTIQNILEEASLPLGLHFVHKYLDRFTGPKGFDALIYQAAQNLPNVKLRLLPVLEHERITRELETDYDEERRSKAVADVYPYGDAQLDFLLGKIDEAALLADELGAWAADFRHVPFYSLFMDTAHILHKSPGQLLYQKRDRDHTSGGDARKYDDQRVFIGYALVITSTLPEPGPGIAFATQEDTIDEASGDEEDEEEDTDEDEDDDTTEDTSDSGAGSEGDGTSCKRKRGSDGASRAAKKARVPPAQEV